MTFYKGTKGFTLIELLVVVAIIALLTSIVTVALGSAKQKSRDSRRVADIKSIQLALSLYFNDNYMYPKNIYADSSSGSAPDNGLKGGYLPVVPSDPSVTPVCTTAGTEAGCYRYSAHSTSGSACSATANIPVKYHLGAIFEDTSNSELTKDVDLAAAGGTGFIYCNGSGAPNGGFNGNSPACTTASGAEGCYDQAP